MLKFHVISTLILGLCAVGCACGGLGDDDDTSSGSPDAFDDDTAPIMTTTRRTMTRSTMTRRTTTRAPAKTWR
ncbi:MAG: hypothetical protein M5R36_04270 [Deltaproteobacteria bacterium]|nr:hypothetical protein [Deltaproteobacteria bacterium]